MSPLFVFGQEEEVRRVMGYYKSALKRYGDLEDVEARWMAYKTCLADHPTNKVWVGYIIYIIPSYFCGIFSRVNPLLSLG